MSGSTTAIVVAIISAGVSLTAALVVEISRRRSARVIAEQQATNSRELEELKDSLARKREEESKSEEAERLVARYRDPMLRAAYDLQGRLYNVLRPGGFRGGLNPEYFRLNTAFVIGQFFGWLEIIRLDLQFLDLGAIPATKELDQRLERVQDVFASTATR
jgi:hypothetical protein